MKDLMSKFYEVVYTPDEQTHKDKIKPSGHFGMSFNNPRILV